MNVMNLNILDTGDILVADDKELNAFVSLKKIAPYHHKGSNEDKIRKKRKHLRQVLREKRQELEESLEKLKPSSSSSSSKKEKKQLESTEVDDKDDNVKTKKRKRNRSAKKHGEDNGKILSEKEEKKRRQDLYS